MNLALLDGVSQHFEIFRRPVSKVRPCFNVDGPNWLQDVRTTVETLQLLGLAAAVVGASGRVIMANDLFQADDVPWTMDADNVLMLVDNMANERLNAALALISAKSVVESIPLRQNPNIVRHVLHVMPVRHPTLEFAEDSVAILAITSASSKAGPLPWCKTCLISPRQKQLWPNALVLANRLRKLRSPMVAAFTRCAVSSRAFWPRQAAAVRPSSLTF